MPSKPKPTPRRRSQKAKEGPADPYAVLARAVQFFAGMEAGGGLRLPYGGYRETIYLMELTAHDRPKPSKVPR